MKGTSLQKVHPCFNINIFNFCNSGGLSYFGCLGPLKQTPHSYATGLDFELVVGARCETFCHKAVYRSPALEHVTTSGNCFRIPVRLKDISHGALYDERV